MTTRRTATIDRQQIYGTPRYQLWVTYRGHALRWSDAPDITSLAVVQNDPTPTHHRGKVIATDVLACRFHAERLGFTHVRITGDWDKRTKPQGGAL